MQPISDRIDPPPDEDTAIEMIVECTPALENDLYSFSGFLYGDELSTDSVLCKHFSDLMCCYLMGILYNESIEEMLKEQLLHAGCNLQSTCVIEGALETLYIKHFKGGFERAIDFIHTLGSSVLDIWMYPIYTLKRFVIVFTIDEY